MTAFFEGGGGGYGPFNYRIRGFDGFGAEQLRVELPFTGTPRYAFMTGELLIWSAQGRMVGTEVSTWTTRWEQPSLEDQLDSLIERRPADWLSPGLVRVGEAEMVTIYRVEGGGTRLVEIDVETGQVVVSRELPWVLDSPIADEAGTLYARARAPSSQEPVGTLAFTREGAVKWLYPNLTAVPVAVFEGRLFLSDGQALSTADASVLYALEGPISDVRVTRDRLYFKSACAAGSTADSECFEIRAHDPATGTRLWAYRTKGISSTPMLIGAEATVHLSVTTSVSCDRSHGCAANAKWLSLNRHGVRQTPVLLPESSMHSVLHQRGDVLVFERSANIGNQFDEYSADARLAPPELRAPHGWIAPDGDSEGHFRPE